MNHDTAIEMRAAERYWSKDLSSAEQDNFEDHFFSCEECAEEVRWEKIFAGNARSAFREEAQPARPARPTGTEERKRIRPSWRDWFGWQSALRLSAAANFALLLVAGYLGLQVSRLSSPHFYPVYFLPSTARSNEQVFEVSKDSKFVGLQFDLPDREAESYECEILDQANKREFASPVPVPADSNIGSNLMIPVSSLKPGSHTLVLRERKAGQQLEAARSTFTIQFRAEGQK